MKNSNCGNCPHIHRCYATNDDECIDTIIGKKHYMTDRDRQIRADAIEECIDKFAEILSNIPNICGIECPVRCSWGAEGSCKEMCKKWLAEQLKDK